MNIYDEFFSIIKKLNIANIRYAVVGGIALSFHTQPRYTKDIDILILSEDVSALKAILKEAGYIFEASPWTFRNTNITLHRLTKIEGEDSLAIDLLLGNEERHKEIIKNAVIEETEYGLTCIASREDLIWMKRLRIQNKILQILRHWKMTKIEKVVREIENLQDFYKKTKLLRERIKKNDREYLKIKQKGSEFSELKN